jgi:K+-sensing histidine kinase KdpD
VFRFNRLLWSKPSRIWSYGVALLSNGAAFIIARMAVHLGTPPGVVFLFAVMLSGWYGGLGPALLATALSSLAFHYYFLPPIHSLRPMYGEVPRLFMGIVTNLIIGLLSAGQRNVKESLRSARDDLKRTVQDLQRTCSVRLDRAAAVVETIRPSREERNRASQDSGDKHQESEAGTVFDCRCRQTLGLERPV